MQKNLKNYTILSKIASGGMSEVYLAQDKNTSTKVALKILDSKLSIDPEYVHRFKKEASISSQLLHKNIVKILDYGTFKESYYIAYEYIEGITLDKYIKQRSLTVPEIENIAIQILEGLSFAHSKNIVHRDIKPSNIMIEDGTVKILDFGIAKQELASTVTKTGLFMGSPHYVSPEQIEGHDIDYRSDIYSFGVVLYEMIEGKVPFSSDTPWGIIRAHLDKKIPEITQDAPFYLKEIVRKCLLKGKEYRPKSAQEIIELIKNRDIPADKTIIIDRDIILEREIEEKKTKKRNEENVAYGGEVKKKRKGKIVAAFLVPIFIIIIIVSLGKISQKNQNYSAQNKSTSLVMVTTTVAKTTTTVAKTTTTEFRNNATTTTYNDADYQNNLAEEKFLNNMNSLLDEYKLAFNHMYTYHKEGWIYNDPSDIALEETFLIKLQELSNKLESFSFPNSLSDGRNNLVNISRRICEVESAVISCMKSNDYEGYVANYNDFWKVVDQLFNTHNSLVNRHNNKYHNN